MKPTMLLRLLIVSAVVSGLPLGAVRAQNPQSTAAGNPHGPLGPKVDCADCHTATGWKTLRQALKFNHADTRFALTGMHAAVRCTGCHLDLRFDEPKVVAAQCESCHSDVHRGNLVGACVRCHNTRSFKDVPAVAVHNRTAFPLTGAHLQAPCESCHRTERNGAYTAVARDCVSCHQSALAQATVVDHSILPRDCTTCHTPFSWSGGVAFDHATAAHGFRLEGAHGSLRCASCHLPGGNALKFTARPAGAADCIACHQPDYQRAHGGNGYSTTCTGCHDVNSWSSNFAHDQAFPISSGPHRTSCATCHTTPGDFRVFTCITCHQHSRASMDSHHQGRSGYVYDSRACYQCHPRGKH